MNRARFNHSLEDSIKYLKFIELFKKRGLKNTGEHSSIFKKVSRQNNHGLIHSTAVQNLDWEIMLEDDSLFQFTFVDEHNLRYSFIQNPNIFVSKTDYLRYFFEDNEVLDEYEDLVAEIKEDEFEQFQQEQNINTEAHIIRYDYDCKGFKKLIHPSSHIHVGFSESLRIPVKFIMSPLEFVFFVIRHSYSPFWEKSFANHSDFLKYLGDEKKRCSAIHSGFWDIEEEEDSFLT